MPEPSRFNPDEWVPNWLAALEKNRIAPIPNEFDGMFNYDLPEVDWVAPSEATDD